MQVHESPLHLKSGVVSTSWESLGFTLKFVDLMDSWISQLMEPCSMVLGPSHPSMWYLPLL
jgi:hypothetical protein